MIIIFNEIVAAFCRQMQLRNMCIVHRGTFKHLGRDRRRKKRHLNEINIRQEQEVVVLRRTREIDQDAQKLDSTAATNPTGAKLKQEGMNAGAAARTWNGLRSNDKE